MLRRIGIPDDMQKLEVLICLREIIDLASYNQEVDEYSWLPA